MRMLKIVGSAPLSTRNLTFCPSIRPLINNPLLLRSTDVTTGGFSLEDVILQAIVEHTESKTSAVGAKAGRHVDMCTTALGVNSLRRPSDVDHSSLFA